MNTYTKLKLHLERHMYKRGQFKGDAPAEQDKRAKTHLRVIQKPDCMVVRMYNTDIIAAYEDGSIKLSVAGWWKSTTLKNLNTALRTFVPFRIRVGGRRVFGMQQHTINCQGTTYAFYDGIRFNAEGTLTSQPLAFERRQADKKERAEFRMDVAASGFKDAFPLLYVNAEAPEDGWMPTPMTKVVRSNAHVNDWTRAVSIIKYPRFRHRVLNWPAYDDWRDAWKYFMSVCTKDMTKVVRTDVITL